MKDIHAIHSRLSEGKEAVSIRPESPARATFLTFIPFMHAHMFSDLSGVVGTIVPRGLFVKDFPPAITIKRVFEVCAYALRESLEF